MTCKSKTVKWFKNRENILVICTIISVILAIVVTIPIRNYCDLNYNENSNSTKTCKISSKDIYLIRLPGTILMNLLKMMILPLLIFSLLTGLTSLNLRTSGKLGGYTVAYYVSTTFLAVLLGMAMVSIIRPGERTSLKIDNLKNSTRRIDPAMSVVNLFLNLFPNNIVRSTFQQSDFYFTKELKLVKYYTDATNFLGIIFFTILFGIIVSTFEQKAKPLVKLFNILSDVTTRMITYILYYMPIGIFFLILASLLSMDDLGETLKTIGLFAVTVIACLSIHLLLILPLIYLVFVRKNPFKFMIGMGKAMMVAFVTQSSSATLPVTMKCAQQNNNIDPRVTKFMLPIGAIINMDGTALYEAIAAIFIAQINGFHLSGLQMVKISVTSTLAAIGAATVPSAGLVTLLIVLTTSGLPTHQVALLYSLDWFLDRCRTAVNIMGDAYGCGIIQKICHAELGEVVEVRDPACQEDSEMSKL